jgi:hypothetical protein
MSKTSKVLQIIASLLVIGAFFFPIWQIKLDAPQFPEGLEMDIWVNKISGSSPNVLQNINILNHYIGMKKITPESIPELKIIPIVLILMIVLGMVVAFTNNKYLMLAWVLLFILAGVIGLYDFYTWLYDYGHNLDPRAPIKIPGMVYQPPLFGSKWLLNFHSHSYPAMGSAFIGMPVLLSSIGIIKDFFVKSK